MQNLQTEILLYLFILSKSSIMIEKRKNDLQLPPKDDRIKKTGGAFFENPTISRKLSRNHLDSFAAFRKKYVQSISPMN